MSSRPSCWRSATCTSEAPSPAGRSIRGKNQPCPCRGKPRSCHRRRCGRSDRSMPLPSRSAERICAGSFRWQAWRPARSRSIQREERDGVVICVHAGEQATLIGDDEGDVARGVARVDGDRGRKAAGLARPPCAIEDIAGCIDHGNIGGAVAVHVGDKGVSRRTRSISEGSEKVPSSLQSRTSTSSGLVRAIARSVRPSPVKSPVATAVEYRRSRPARWASGPGTCRQGCPDRSE